jgi:phage portal protein BeeE
MTYANVEQRSVHLLVYTLDPWLVRIERMFTSMLPRPQYVAFNRDALLRTTTFERYRTHALALANAWKTVNEVRNLEDLPPVAWGEEPYAAALQSIPGVGPSGTDTTK